MYSEEHKRYLKREKDKKQLITFFKIAIIGAYLSLLLRLPTAFLAASD